jgi:glyceraldehyde 3-phosphate dehydrogenase
VVEATARKWSRAQLEKHLQRGAKRVILCAPAQDPPDITVVMGVNDDRLKSAHRIVSNGSCTAHCAAPIIKILHEAFGIRRSFLSTVHAYTNQQRLADVPSEDKRRGRAAAENIIPQQTDAALMVSALIPEIEGRISGGSMNVPVPNGSVVDLVCWHEKPVTTTAVNEVIRTAASIARWREIIDYEDEPVVSSDIIRSPYSATFDSLATMVMAGHVSKTLAWYDNGWGYAHRVVDLINRFSAMEKEAA